MVSLARVRGPQFESNRLVKWRPLQDSFITRRRWSGFTCLPIWDPRGMVASQEPCYRTPEFTLLNP